MPRISIIVPIYNVEKYLDRCMESLLSQTLKDIEIIMVDDGSPDSCPQMCDEYAKKDSRIKVIHKKNAGLGYARNSGLEIATGEYVAFMDSDDYVEKGMYEALYNAAKKDNCDAAFCGFRTETAPGKWVYSNEVEKDELWTGGEVRSFMLDMIASGAHVKKERLYQMSVWHSIYKHSVIKENNIRFVSEREVGSEDIPFQVDFLLKSNRVAYLKETFHSYCLNGTSLTATLKKEKYERYKSLRECLLQKSSDIEFRRRVNRLFIGYARVFCYDIINSKWKGKINLLKEIQNDIIWKQLQNEYNEKDLPLMASFVYKLILSGNTFLLAFLIWLITEIRSNRG